LTFAFLLTSCIADIPELELNTFEDENIVHLEITSHEYSFLSGTVTINYEVYYDWESNPGITGVALIKDGVKRFTTSDPTLKSFTESNLPFSGRICYKVAFNIDGDLYGKSTEELCIDL